MGPWRHSLFGGRTCSKHLTDLGQQLPGSAYYGIAMDPLRRLWLAQYAGTIYYGTYDRAGVCTHIGSVSGLPSGTGYEPTQIRVDPDLCCWFCAAQYEDRLYYGSYNPATGEPTITGYVSITGMSDDGRGLNGIVLDPDLRRWWCGNDSGANIPYGTYDVLGVPTQSGVQSVASSQSQSMMIDPARRHIWISGAPNIYVYDIAGLLTATTTPYVSVWRGAVDMDRSLAIAASPDRTKYVLYDVDHAGTLTELDSLTRSTLLHAFDVDSDLGLALCTDGHMISYCA